MLAAYRVVTLLICDSADALSVKSEIKSCLHLKTLNIIVNQTGNVKKHKEKQRFKVFPALLRTAKSQVTDSESFPELHICTSELL